MNHTEKTIPVWKKYSLNISEAAEYYGIGARYRTSVTYIAANNRNGGYEHCNHADRKYTVADYSSITAAYGTGTGACSSAARTD